MQAAASIISQVEAQGVGSEQDVVPLAVESLPAVEGSSHRLAIFWSDGFKYTYNAKDLRFYCPCAVCVDEFSGKRRITPDSIAQDVSLEKALPVGRYGVNLVWTDKHTTGIYTYKYLRELDAEKVQERPNPPEESARLSQARS
ncbi:MAG: DUF971 domain-containing protein [Oligoflexia bacterium]|nr:DUF971 domain-containing protein [Oligoflexia bacterium]